MKTGAHAFAFSIGLACAALAASREARADEPLTGPPTDTQGKSVSPPAPVEGITPKLAGLNFIAGVAFVDFGPLNDRLASSGYPNKLPLTFPLLGGQGFGLFNRFTIGGSGSGFLSRSVSAPNNGEISASGAWGTVDVGYQLVRVNGFFVAPVLSLGGYGLFANIHSKDEDSFSDVLGSPARGTTLTNRGVLAGLSVMANLIVLGKPSTVPNARSGLSLGLRLGGLYGIPYREWKADGVTIEGGPKFGLRGGYAALSLGVGTW
ncbi:MAG: hypothetical protein ACOY0T_10620 [Myxococcota bacterium]